MIGKELNQNLMDYIDINASEAQVNAEFKIFGKDVLFEVGYCIKLVKENGEVEIEREYLNCAINKEGNRTNKNIFMDYQCLETDGIFKPQKRLDEVINKNQETKMDLIVAKKWQKKVTVLIFSEKTVEKYFVGSITMNLKVMGL